MTDKKDFHTASKYCEETAANLASVLTEDEQQFVAGHTQAVYDVDSKVTTWYIGESSFFNGEILFNAIEKFHIINTCIF